MDYSDCIPIRGRICTAWLVKFKDCTKLLLWASDAKIEQVVQYINLHYSNNSFCVQEIDVGDFNLDSANPSSNYYSSDGRTVNQDLQMGEL
jgi:hypothetical protein